MAIDSRSQKADALLKGLQKKEGGQLKIFLGAAPGVGKTCGMLNAAKERVQQGVSVVVGLIETHGRTETEALLQGLSILPRRELEYHGQCLTEFDLDAALAEKPQLILVDELAHTNVPGSRHKRRYQDIAELLAAGIDVYTTLNIQHIASLNDLVLQVSGIRVKETVPDQFIDHAQELVFVDLAPNHLLDRLSQGKVYLSDYAEQAVQQFFQLETLTALREMAMKLVMSHVDTQLKIEQEAKDRGSDYLIKDKVLVLISNRRDHEYLIRAGRRMAEKRQTPWLVVWVDTGQTQYQAEQKRLQSAFALARELGAQTDILRGPSTKETVLPYLTEHRINTVLVGAGNKRWFQPWRQPLYQQLINSGLPLEVSVWRVGEREQATKVSLYTSTTFGQKRGYVYGLLFTLVASLFAQALTPWLQSGNLVLVYVLFVVLCGLKFGARPAIFTALLSFLSFNFLLTEPYYTFFVNKNDDIATLLFMLVIGIVCGPAASRIRQQFLLLKEANRYSELQRDFAQQLTVVNQTGALWETLAMQVSQALHCTAHVVSIDQHEKTISPTLTEKLQTLDQAMIDWCHRHQQRAGRFSDTLNASNWAAFPLLCDQQTIAVLILKFSSEQQVLRQDDTDLLDILSQQAINVWQRIHLNRELESSKLKAEMEQLRSALLSSVSHDLRSPLSAMMGSAESLQVLDSQLSSEDRRELLDTIVQESRRLDRYIQNLLDMTRLGHGTLKLERDWVSIDDIIGSAKQRLKRFFPDVQVDYQSQPNTPLLYAHAALLEQGIFNILENAAKYTQPEEPVQVLVSQQGQVCCIEIEDSGPGIAKDLREKVFDMFYVVADGDSKRHNTGMGLAICRGMIGAHGGTVKADAARVGSGSRFIIELPLPEIKTGE
ncbi:MULTISPECIES: sensor histidine kinase [Marinomonas]|uniref:histidine kinase n=1 Tax=Marinomonas arctica TaxID=383750 RepID=A0A7H1J9Z0_9GAMM|nr:MULTISPECIES: sensor histidine kinase KdpD [Marinomonas]MCS7488544.1 histidine kinase [Marinomonas sp. BSi20414]QNT07306.1 sensor histidine kinase KdpD [Marinomonas arctica]GGN27646.1 two-component sensor histidine kinase [Marinomonas arctica]